LDKLFDGNPLSRFYFLETVARMPYFSYITMLHTYETLGWWRRSTETKRIHFAEEYNEYHHLLIMESLGGDQEWRVRFFAQHSAIVYYFVLIALWIFSPSLAYNFSELIEAHAVDTYAEFAESNKELLQKMAAPPVAKSYYEAVDMYHFDEFQTNTKKGTRRPMITSLYDVFMCIKDDEQAHVDAMARCQDPNVVLQSPNTEAAAVASALAAGFITYAVVGAIGSGNVVDLDAIKGTYDSLLGNMLTNDAELAVGIGGTAMGMMQEGGSNADIVSESAALEGGIDAAAQKIIALLASGAALLTTALNKIFQPTEMKKANETNADEK
jgi:ubiquinol oxidase